MTDRCTLCGKLLKTNPEETCEGEECEGTYEFKNDSNLTFYFCERCRRILEEKDRKYNGWKLKRTHSLNTGTYKSGE